MASDSRGTDEHGMHLTDCQKLYTLKSGSILGTAGDFDARKIIKMLDKVEEPEALPSRKRLAKTKVDFLGILVFPSGKVFLIEIEQDASNQEWAGSVIEMEDNIVAIGTGSQFAYGAMEAGMTAPQAVAVACKRDTNSALPVKTLELQTKGK